MGSGHMMPRRDPLRDFEVTARLVKEIGTATARVFPGIVDRPDVAHIQALALLAVAHYLDLMRVAGRNDPVYPADLGELIGCSQKRAVSLLLELKKRGLVAGSATGGYTLAGPLA